MLSAWTVNHTPGSPSKYMTTIYNYFCKKMIFFRGSMPPNPPSKRMATQAHPPKKVFAHPWQILHTPMNYY